MYFGYVLRNPQERLYVGYTENLERRVRQHQAGEAGWTKSRGPWELVHSEAFADLAEAMRREKNLKRGKQNQELRQRFGR